MGEWGGRVKALAATVSCKGRLCEDLVDVTYVQEPLVIVKEFAV